MKIGRSGSITKIGFRTGNVTTAQTLKVELQTVDLGTGYPSGSLYGGSAKGTQASPASNTYYEVTLGTPATANAGDYIAVVIEFDSTIGNLEIDVVRTGAAGDDVGYPFVATRIGGSWSKATEDWPICHFVFSGTPDIYDANMCWPLNDCFEHSSGSGSTAQMGLKFQIPFKARLVGVFARYRPRGDNNMKLLAANDSVIDSVLYDEEVWHSSTADRWAFLPLSTPRIIEKNTVYRYVTMNTGDNGQFLYGMKFLNNNILGAWTAKNCHYSYRSSDVGAWTDETTWFPYMQLMFDQIDADGGLPTNIFNQKFN